MRAADFLGVRLQPEDVAEVVWRAATHRGQRLHWTVGVQTRLAMHAARLAPTRLERMVVRLLSSRGGG